MPETHVIRIYATREPLATASQRDLCGDLTPHHAAVATHGDGPLLIIAGALKHAAGNRRRSFLCAMAVGVSFLTCNSSLEGQPSGAYSITGIVVGSGGSPLPYSTVSVREINTERFANARGEFRFGDLAEGLYHLRIRQLGYIARDFTVVLGSDVTPHSLRVTLTPITFHLATIVVRGNSNRCTVTATRAAKGDPDLATILTEVSKNADREILIRSTYPFEYTLTQRFDRPDLDGPGHDITEYVKTYDSRQGWTYRMGRVVEADASSGDAYTRLMHTPGLPNLADPEFQSTHCYAYAGVVTERRAKAHLINFRPLDTLSTPDVEGSVFLDEKSFLIRRVDFKLTRPERLTPPILGLSSRTTYREILPGVALIDEIHAVQPVKPWTTGEQGADVTQTQKLTRFRFLSGTPGDSLDQQTQTSRRRTAGSLLSGVVRDSVRGGYLKGAAVTVAGTNRRAISDSVGRFRIDSIPDGEYAIKISHAFLDTLAVSIATVPIRFAGNDSVALVLGTPSARTIVARKCSATERAEGPAAIIGTVFDADTEAPSVGAQVTLAWGGQPTGDKAVQSAHRTNVATVREDGAFKMCGVPKNLVTNVFAFRAADTTAAFGVNLSPLLAIVSFHLSPSEAFSEKGVSAGLGKATVIGRIVDIAGAPLRGARVAFDSEDRVTVSASDGSFRVSALRPGTRGLGIRLLGYEPVDSTIDVSSRTLRSVSIVLTKAVPILQTVRVTAPIDAGFVKVGFTERRRLGNGIYFGPKEIEDRNSPRLSRLLETTTALSRYKCVRYFVDGLKWSRLAVDDPSLGPDNYLSGAELAAVEVYTPFTVPSEFFAQDRNGVPCVSVVVWTKWKVTR